MHALFVTADHFEDVELTSPQAVLEKHGYQYDIAAPKRGTVTGKKGVQVEANLALNAVKPEDYELLILPGGKAPAELREHPAALAIAREFLKADKAIAAICHGPQVLISTGLMRGRTATAYPEVGPELEQAGVHYLDEEVVLDGNLITSRTPDDLPAFEREFLRKLDPTDDKP